MRNDKRPSKGRVIECAKALNLPALKALLDAKPVLLHVTDRDGRNLLHLACSVPPAKVKVPASKAVRVVEWLLDRGLPIDAPVGRDACTPLFFAVARARSPGLVKLEDRAGISPRLKASRKRDKRFIAALAS